MSIAVSSPHGFPGKYYDRLAPNWWFLKKYKQDGDEDFYVEQYHREILSKLDARQVYDELGEDAVLLCWERAGAFCHRRLVAEWFEKELGISVPEWEGEIIQPSLFLNE